MITALKAKSSFIKEPFSKYTINIDSGGYGSDPQHFVNTVGPGWVFF